MREFVTSPDSSEKCIANLKLFVTYAPEHDENKTHINIQFNGVDAAGNNRRIQPDFSRTGCS